MDLASCFEVHASVPRGPVELQAAEQRSKWFLRTGRWHHKGATGNLLVTLKKMQCLPE